jgi:dolichol-phosphate mannosyltransferase
MAKTRLDYELILVDDGSRDTTADEIRIEARANPSIRGLSLGPGGGMPATGQSAALWVGLGLASGRTLVTLDADLQNDPAEIPRLLEELARSGSDMVQGDRTASRCDGLPRRIAGAVGRIARRVVLGDRTRDTGCTLRVFRREVLEALPLEYAGTHRFVPFCARLRGFRVIETPVLHRPRVRGVSKVGGVSRAMAGAGDLLAMRWMRARLRRPTMRSLDPPGRVHE